MQGSQTVKANVLPPFYCQFLENLYIIVMGKKVCKKIPEETLRAVLQKLDDARSLIDPYLVVLNDQERQALSQIGTELIKYLELSHGIAVEYPELFPAFVKTAAFREEFFITCELRQIINKIDGMKEKILDTEMLAGNQALDTALAFYNTVKIAARRDIPGTRFIYDKLKPAFRSGKQAKKKRSSMSKDAPGFYMQPELF